MKLLKTTCCHAHLAQFDCHLRSFGLSVEVDPKAESPEAFVHLVELGDNGRALTGAFTLRLAVNYHTWREVAPAAAHPEGLAPLVDEFFRDFPAALKSIILNEIKAPHYDEDACMEAFSMSGGDIEEGLLVSYTQVMNYQKTDDKNRSLWFGFFLKDGSVRYAVDDLYCPNPKCDCREVHLAFSEITSEKDEAFCTTDRFFARVSFKNAKKCGYKLDDLRRCSRKKAEGLVARLFEQEPDLISTCKRRYQKIRQATKRIHEAYRKSRKMYQEPQMDPLLLSSSRSLGLDVPIPFNELSPTGKVGRNSPCPCGSGRKYKACCGKELKESGTRL